MPIDLLNQQLVEPYFNEGVSPDDSGTYYNPMMGSHMALPVRIPNHPISSGSHRQDLSDGSFWYGLLKQNNEIRDKIEYIRGAEEIITNAYVTAYGANQMLWPQQVMARLANIQAELTSMMQAERNKLRIPSGAQGVSSGQTSLGQRQVLCPLTRAIISVPDDLQSHLFNKQVIALAIYTICANEDNASGNKLLHDISGGVEEETCIHLFDTLGAMTQSERQAASAILAQIRSGTITSSSAQWGELVAQLQQYMDTVNQSSSGVTLDLNGLLAPAALPQTPFSPGYQASQVVPNRLTSSERQQKSQAMAASIIAAENLPVSYSGSQASTASISDQERDNEIERLRELYTTNRGNAGQDEYGDALRGRLSDDVISQRVFHEMRLRGLLPSSVTSYSAFQAEEQRLIQARGDGWEVDSTASSISSIGAFIETVSPVSSPSPSPAPSPAPPESPTSSTASQPASAPSAPSPSSASPSPSVTQAELAVSTNASIQHTAQLRSVGSGINVQTVGPYQAALGLPNVPVVFPYDIATVQVDSYNMANLLPRFPLSARVVNTSSLGLPTNINTVLNSLDIEGGSGNCEVMISFQSRPPGWDSQQCLLRPHPWLHPDAPQADLSYGGETSTVAVSLAGVGETFRPPAVVPGIWTHNENMAARFSTRELPIQGLRNHNMTDSFYSFCAERNPETGRYVRAGVTFHCMLNAQDEQNLRLAMAMLESLPSSERNLTGLIQILESGTLGAHTIPVAELRGLILGDRPSSPSSAPAGESSINVREQLPLAPSAARGVLTAEQLRYLVQSGESSMSSVSSQSLGLLNNIKRQQGARYRQMGGYVGVINHFRNYCEQNFGTLSPLSTTSQARQLSTSDRLNYINNHWHTAYRYFGYPRNNTTIPSQNIFMDPNAPYQTDREVSYGHYESTTSALSSGQLEDIAYYWLAVSDPDLDSTLRGQLQESFASGLAQLTRGHNWDRQRTVTRSNGRWEQEYYDDQRLDRPTCGAGVNNRLTMTLVGHPLLEDRSSINIMDDITVRFQEFRIQTFREYLSSLSSTERARVIEILPQAVQVFGGVGGFGIEDNDEWDDILLYAGQDSQVQQDVERFIGGYQDYFRQRLNDFHTESRRRYGARYRNERPTHNQTRFFVDMGSARGSAANVVYRSYEAYFQMLSDTFLGAHPNSNGVDFSPTILSILDNPALGSIAQAVHQNPVPVPSPQVPSSSTGASLGASLYGSASPQVPSSSTGATQSATGASSSVRVPVPYPSSQSDDYRIDQISYFGEDHPCIRSRGVNTAGPYRSQMPMPTVPVFHPYNPTAGLQVDAPHFPLAVSFPADEAEHLPPGVEQLLIANNLTLNNLTVNVSFQEHGWRDGTPLLFRPHTQLHAGAPENGSYNRASNLLVAVAGSREGFSTISSQQGVSTHPSPRGVVYSPENLELIGDQGRGNTQNLYSLCIDRTEGQAYLTLHSLLSQRDLQTVEQVIRANRPSTGHPSEELIMHMVRLIGERTGVDTEALRYLVEENYSAGAPAVGQASGYRLHEQPQPSVFDMSDIRGLIENQNDRAVLDYIRRNPINSSNVDTPILGGTALGFAVYYGCYEAAQELIRRGASLTGAPGASPLDYLNRSPVVTGSGRDRFRRLLGVAPVSASSPSVPQQSAPQVRSPQVSQGAPASTPASLNPELLTEIRSLMESQNDQAVLQWIRTHSGNINARTIDTPLLENAGTMLGFAVYYGCYGAAQELVRRGASLSGPSANTSPVDYLNRSPVVTGSGRDRFRRLLGVAPVSASSPSVPQQSAPQVRSPQVSQGAPASTPASLNPELLTEIRSLMESQNDQAVLQWIRAHSSRINTTNISTPLLFNNGDMLCFAVYYGCYQSAQELLRLGASPITMVNGSSAVDFLNRSPVVTGAARERYRNLFDENMLQQAPVVAPTPSAFTPLMNVQQSASRSSPMSEVRVNAGRGLLESQNDQSALSWVRENINSQNVDTPVLGGTLLGFAMYYGCYQTAQELIDRGAMLSGQPGSSPLDFLNRSPVVTGGARDRFNALLQQGSSSRFSR